MTEDMRERFVETVGNQIMLAQILREKVDEKLRELWQAALSSAGTSGTLPIDARERWQRKAVKILDEEQGEQVRNAFTATGRIWDELIVPMLRGDSLSGKGEATKKCPNCGGEIVSTAHGFYCPKPMCKWGWETEMDGSPLQPPSAPDRYANGTTAK